MKRFSTKFDPQTSRSFLLAVVFIAAIALFSPVYGKTLKEYQENISHLKTDFATIIDNNNSGEPDADYENELFEEVPKILPAEETIESGERSFSVNNVWITSRIADYKNETRNQKRKETILSEIYERLESIELKLRELEASKDSAQTKDANKRKIAEILSREQFQKPTDTGESFLQKLWRQILEWISSIFPKPKISPNANTGVGSLVYYLQILLYVGIFAVISFLFYKFAPLIYSRIKESRKPDRSERVILGEKLSANATPLTLFSEAEKMASEGDLKGAIRKGYIALLFELSDRKHLALAIHKTNRDYLRDVRSKKALYKNVTGLTANYERHWYGLTPVVQQDWEEFRRDYINAVGDK